MDYTQTIPDVWVNKDRFTGTPCLKGTRVPVAQIIAEIADGRSIGDVAEDMDLPEEQIKDLFEHIANLWNHRFQVDGDKQIKLTIKVEDD